MMYIYIYIYLMMYIYMGLGCIQVFIFHGCNVLVISSPGCSVISVAFITFMCIYFTYATYLADLQFSCGD
jgi:hypothetical protein